MLPGEEVIYNSSDTVEQEHVYPMEFINRLNPPGFPAHKLVLKKGCCVMLLRNMDPRNGHCNGSRYIITELGVNIIEGLLIGGKHKGKKLLIPRISLTPPENFYPFTMRRKQFPIKIAAGITSNKAQGQSLKKIGIYLPTQFFSHGQLYVALSRVGKFENLKILCANNFVENVVYKEVLIN
jgi:ATP-dependent DNA helicase PIF1